MPNLYPYLPEDWDERMEEQAYAYLLYHGASAWCPVTMEWATARDYESSWYQDLTAQGYAFSTRMPRRSTGYTRPTGRLPPC